MSFDPGSGMAATVSAPESFRTSQRLSYAGQLCTVRYVGPVAGTTGLWLGVEWDNPTLGKHAGTHNGVKYFDCLSPLPTAASFVRPTRPHDPSRSFLDALRDKYVAEASPFVPSNKKQIFFNGKLAEEVGFEKVAAQQATLGELRIVVLDGLRVAGLKATGNDDLRAGHEWSQLVNEITSTCCNITELDLSRSLLEGWADVVGICEGLPKLKKLVLDGNRLDTGPVRSDAGLQSRLFAWAKIEELSARATLQTWDQISNVLKFLPSLKQLSLASNNLSTPFTTPLTLHLAHLDLSDNPLRSFDAIVPFAALPNLSTLTLRKCAINSLTPLPCRFPALKHLDLSSNNISSFTDLSVLPTIFPNLSSFRCSLNPFYASLPTDEAHMLALARLPSIQMLNYSQISDKERENAELYYLSRIRAEASKQLDPATAPSPSLTKESLTQSHPLWESLAAKHNQVDEFVELLTSTQPHNQSNKNNNNSSTTISLSPLTNPSSLGARLVELTCTMIPHHQASTTNPFTLTLPKSVSIYRLKSLIGRSISLLPSRFRLVWETGELDPVGRNIGNPGRVGEGRRIAEAESGSDSGSDSDGGGEAGAEGEEKEERKNKEKEKGKWIKREVVLVDSMRPLGYWIEGARAVIRIEILDDAEREVTMRTM